MNMNKIPTQSHKRLMLNNACEVMHIWLQNCVCVALCFSLFNECAYHRVSERVREKKQRRGKKNKQ